MRRKDEWNFDDDLLLAQTVLEHIENGKTQLKAFEEVALRLKRTPAACGFRWNSTVRKKFDKQIKSAKLESKSEKKHLRKSIVSTITHGKDLHTESQHSGSPFDPLIQTLTMLKREYERMRETIDDLTKQVSHLTLQVENHESAKSLVSGSPSEDMQNLMQIIRRAEQLGLFEKNVPKEKPAG